MNREIKFRGKRIDNNEWIYGGGYKCAIDDELLRGRLLVTFLNRNMTVRRQNKIHFTNVCGCVCDEMELERAILWYQKSPTASKKKIYMHGFYPAVSIHDEKIHVHRLLMLYWNGGKIQSKKVVHHINGNKLDASKNNLCLIDSDKHARKHNLGKVISEEQKQRIREFNIRTKKGKRMKSKRTDVTNEMVYKLRASGYSFNKISKLLKIDWGCVKQRYNDYIHDNPEFLKGGEK